MLRQINNFKFLANYKFLLVLLTQSSCCFLVTNQQFPFPQFGPHRHFDSFPHNNIGRANNFNNPPAASNLKHESWLSPGQELIFQRTTTSRPSAGVVFVNNQPTNPTMVPFIAAATTPTPQFLNCFGRCPTTSEHNPICASNRQLYGNENKFNCARSCGADIQIVRRGSCEGLFPMSRG